MRGVTARRNRPPFERVGLGELRIDDERALRHVPLYAPLKQRLLDDGHRFRVARTSDWNRALLLNLGFWSPRDPADVLTGRRIPADVVAHVAWHHVAARALGEAASSADGLLFAESVASAFDLYLVGKLLDKAPRSTFLATQVPAMADVAESAGLGRRAFARLLGDIARDPDAAFAELRALLFHAGARLVRVKNTDAAARVLEGFAAHRFHALLHHYNLASWVLYCRAHASPIAPRVLPAIARVDRALGRAPIALEWLARQWL